MYIYMNITCTHITCYDVILQHLRRANISAEGVIGNAEDEVGHVMEYQHLQVSTDDKTRQIIIM